MNTIVKILLYLAKILNAWVLVIPAKLNIIATFIYFGIIYLFFGTFDMNEVLKIIGEGGVAHVLLVIFACVPILVSFVAFMSPEFSVGSNINDNIDSVLNHRNNMMRNSSTKDAYNAMKKTAHLDVIKSSPGFRDAVIGFNASVGKDGPTDIYNDLVND